jgi:hypothetical protein
MTEVTGTATAGSSGNNLEDTGNFASGVQRGDIIRNITTGKYGIIDQVVDANNVTTIEITPGDPPVWSVTNTYEIGSLIQSYNGSDTAFVAYIDREASGSSVQQSLLYTSDRNVLFRARDNGSVPPIIPFAQDSSFNNTGGSFAVIRNEDTVTS